MADYSQGVMADAGCILKDGRYMTIDEIVSELQEARTSKLYMDYLQVKVTTQASIVSLLRKALKESIEWNWMEDDFPASVKELVVMALADSEPFALEEN